MNLKEKKMSVNRVSKCKYYEMHGKIMEIGKRSINEIKNSFKLKANSLSAKMTDFNNSKLCAV